MFDSRVILRRSRERGLNLLEMVISCLIFSTVALSFLGVFSHHYKSVAKARTQLLATHLARTKMLDFAAARFNGVDLLIPIAGGPQLIETIPVTMEIRGMDRTIEFEVWAERTIATAGLGGEKNIAVWVYWQEGDIRRSVTFRTLLSRNG